MIFSSKKLSVRTIVRTAIHSSAVAIFITLSLLTPPASTISPVAKAISECDRYAIEKGSLLTDNEFCETACDEPAESGPTAGVTPGPVYILGDSIGVGVSQPLATALPGADGWSVTGEPLVGRKLAQGLEIARSAPDTLKSAKVVLVSLGTNDLTETSNATNIPALVAAVRAANSGAAIFWLTTNVTRGDLAGKDDAYNAELRKSQGITLIENKVTISGDGIHPANYTELATAVATSIKSSATSGTQPTTGAPTGTATDLAKQMLASSNVKYWTNNGVNTRDIVVALSEGKKAYTTSPEAASKEVDINTNILKFIVEVAQSHTIMVNALTDKDHSSTSNHYKGLAVDLDKNPGNTGAPISVLNEIAAKYGGKKNSETTHHHYDFTSDVAVDPGNSGGETATPTSCCPVSGGGAGGALSANIPEVWRSLIAATAPTYPNVNPNLVAATLWIENRGWPEYKTSGWAISPAPAFAQGPWQFIAPTWASMGHDGDGDGKKDPQNPKDQVHAAFKHQEGSANKPIALEYDGNADSSVDKVFMRGANKQVKSRDTLLHYLKWYNGSIDVPDSQINTYPLGSRGQNIHQNTDYILIGYWLLATDFAKTIDNSGNFIDATKAGAASTGGGAGSPTTTNTSPTGGSCGSGSSTGGAVDGFPLITTKSVIKKGIDGAVWCYINDQTCEHHDYDAADIHVPVDTRVVAAKPGRVVGMSDNASSCGSSVTILGSDNFVYFYTHMKQGSIKVAKQQDVQPGAELGVVGPNACGTAPHLHFDMQPPPATNRPSCASAECSGYTWVDVQPILFPLYERLPE